MTSMGVKLLISDFDGTLVDTFDANYRAYEEAFKRVGLSLSRDAYRNCFGFRFEKFMAAMEITNDTVAGRIKELKAQVYPDYFCHFRVNNVLLSFLRSFRASGGLTAIASTARKKNLLNALMYIDAAKDFDLILAGEDVKKGKPSPEIYENVLQKLEVSASDALVFEDSLVGFQAAEAAGINYIKVNSAFYGD